MSTVQSLRTFVNERLTAAVEEILGVFEKTILVYEEEIDRQRKLLDIVLKPQIKLHRADLSQPFVCKEDLLLDHQHCNQDSTSSLGQEVPEPPQIKKEQEELCSSQEGEQPSVQEEADVCKFTPTSEGSDQSEHESLHSDPDQTQSAAEKEPITNISSKFVKPEADREDSGVSEPNSGRRLRSHNHHVADSEGYKTSSCGNAGSAQRIKPKRQNRPYECDSCSEKFPDLTNFKTHLRSHTKKRSYRCDTCGKVYSRSSNLVAHIRSHTGEKPFRCKLCGKGFSSHSYISHHIRVHTGEKPYNCDICGKKFAFRSTLTEHVRVHKGEKAYECSFCKRKFTLRSTLKQHTTIHTREKPFKCSTCGKAFSQNTALKMHMGIHTGERPYRCSTCDKGFITLPNLKRHMTVHTGSASSNT